MGLFNKKAPQTRSELLTAAAEARGRGKRKKAVQYYEQALTLAPDDHEVHSRLAPLKAEAGQLDEARRSFGLAADGFLQRGFLDKAIGVYRQATGFLSTDVEIWEKLAELNLERQRPADAVTTLLEGRRHLRARTHRGRAVQLLRRVLEIEPGHVEASLDLARLLRRDGKRAEARALLERLAPSLKGRDLRRVRARLFRLAPSAGALWRWLRALLTGR